MIWKILALSQFQSQDSKTNSIQLKQVILSSLLNSQKITQQFAFAIAAGFLFTWLNIPVGWLLGPMVVGIIYAAIAGNSQALPANFMTFGKAFLGLATAVRFSPETLILASNYAVPLIFCIVITGVISLFHGYLLSRFSGINRVTGLLSFIPGLASSIIAIGEEMGADAVAIALFQYLRLLLVIFIVPSLVTFLFPADSVNLNSAVFLTTTPSSVPLFLNLLILAVCCFLGIFGGQKLRLPASGFLGTFIVGLIGFWTLPDYFLVPQWLFKTGLLFVGLSIGLKFDFTTVIKLLKAVLIEIGLVISLILFCLGIAYGFHQFTQVDLVTAVLGLTPGGLEAMIATVVQLGGDTSLVLAIQLTRMLMILLIAPWLTAFVLKQEKRSEDFSE